MIMAGIQMFLAGAFMVAAVWEKSLGKPWVVSALMAASMFFMGFAPHLPKAPA